MLSCYTANLLGHLRCSDSDIDATFASAVELAVRTDLPDGVLAFTQHRRVDPGLGYRAADSWHETKAALTDELARYGDVIVVGSTRNLPWCPGRGVRDVSHWFRLADHRGRQWLVVDDFDAVLPDGRQRPVRTWVTDAELNALLTPLPPLPVELRHRDAYALGVRLRVPEPERYRWLSRHNVLAPPPTLGRWVHGTAAALGFVAQRLVEDPATMRRHADDLWAASRHHQFRWAGNGPVVTAWAGLARSVRFAVESAARGRPRPTLVTRACHEVISATSAAEEPHDTTGIH